MLDRIIHWSLHNRTVTIFAALVLLSLGIWSVATLPVDLFPDLTAPSIAVLAEAPGMAAEEVETELTYPIETAVNGATGVRRVRSFSLAGISVVWVDFDWDSDVFRARQIVGERLQRVAAQFPEGVHAPVMAPVTSLLGEIMLVGMSSHTLTSMEVRSAADFMVRRRLLALSGIAHVVAIGGEIKQYQIAVRPYALRAYDVTLQDVLQAAASSNRNASGGLVAADGREILVRGLGRVESLEEIGTTVVATQNLVPVLIRDVATVKIGPAPRVGAASVDAQSAVVFSIQKQPQANTLELTRRIDAELEDIQQALPEGITVHRAVFRQADFIELSVENLTEALRDGALLVMVILFLFLWSMRATAISLIAIPLSLAAALIAMKSLGIMINTMTLGGMAIAIGALVDDAIIDVDNVFRRLRERRGPPLVVVYEASCEVRGPILQATVIICVVFVPLLFLSGVEGRLLRPLGFAYMTAILASLIVAVTITPALCSILLPGATAREGWLASRLRSWYRPCLDMALAHGNAVAGIAVAALLLALLAAMFLGRGFLPEFQEGTLVASAVTAPGTSLETSDAIGQRAERLLLAHPAVTSTSRRTGRAELDEHTQLANSAEIDVHLDLSEWTVEDILVDLRDAFARVPGLNVTFGQPIGHRIDHMLSGSRTPLVIKLFGPDLHELRRTGNQILEAMRPVDGLVDLLLDQQQDVPQIRLYANRPAMARFGVTSKGLADYIEAGIAGKVVSEIWEDEAVYDLVVRFAEGYRTNLDQIRRAMVTTPAGPRVPLEQLAHVREDKGPNVISRENVRRLITITANVAGRDLGSVVADMEDRLADITLPPGYDVEIGGRYEQAGQTAMTLILLSVGSLLVIFLILFTSLGTMRAALLVMVNLPLALTGGVAALMIMHVELNVAAWVGFISLFGIAVRNGLLLVTRYGDLREGGMSLRQAVVAGSLDRLNPILMTALTAALALLPLALGGGEPGKEIQTPMAIVILGGLLTSTLLNMVVVPVLYERTMRRADKGARS